MAARWTEAVKVFASLSLRDLEGYRPTVSIDNGVDFRRPAAER
jgi:hypothetical protein